MSQFEASVDNNSLPVSNSNSNSLVEVKINTNGSEKVFSFDGSEVYDPNKIAEDAKESNTSFSYSGRHDHGDLPCLLNSNSNNNKINNNSNSNNKCDEGNCSKTDHYLRLVGAVQEAKYALDSYITDDMKKQNAILINNMYKDADADVDSKTSYISNTSQSSIVAQSEELDVDESGSSPDINMPPKKINRIE